MPDAKNDLYLFEALELRAEYDARLKALKALLPEARENRTRFGFRHDDEVRHRPVADFSVDGARDEMAALEVKRRKLNTAIQRVNFDTTVIVDGQELNLAEALELRKAVNERLGELTTRLATSAYERVIYKEGRDIVEAPDVGFDRVRADLEAQRRLFRQLNRSLRAVAYQAVVAFKDDA